MPAKCLFQLCGSAHPRLNKDGGNPRGPAWPWRSLPAGGIGESIPRPVPGLRPPSHGANRASARESNPAMAGGRLRRLGGQLPAISAHGGRPPCGDALQTLPLALPPIPACAIVPVPGRASVMFSASKMLDASTSRLVGRPRTVMPPISPPSLKVARMSSLPVLYGFLGVRAGGVRHIHRGGAKLGAVALEDDGRWVPDVHDLQMRRHPRPHRCLVAVAASREERRVPQNWCPAACRLLQKDDMWAPGEYPNDIGQPRSVHMARGDIQSRRPGDIQRRHRGGIKSRHSWRRPPRRSSIARGSLEGLLRMRPESGPGCLQCGPSHQPRLGRGHWQMGPTKVTSPLSTCRRSMTVTCRDRPAACKRRKEWIVPCLRSINCASSAWLASSAPSSAIEVCASMRASCIKTGARPSCARPQAPTARHSGSCTTYGARVRLLPTVRRLLHAHHCRAVVVLGLAGRVTSPSLNFAIASAAKPCTH